jgi:hypothetical protein
MNLWRALAIAWLGGAASPALADAAIDDCTGSTVRPVTCAVAVEAQADSRSHDTRASSAASSIAPNS